ncbi:MAG: transposase, partial [Ginsengibacter sp.]
MSAVNIAFYNKRWQIELLFKRMKQNYPLKYFLGDSPNAIKIQICCTLVAEILLKIVKKGAAAKWSFSNLAAMIRLHLMTNIDL